MPPHQHAWNQDVAWAAAALLAATLLSASTPASAQPSITYESQNRSVLTVVRGVPEGGYQEGPLNSSSFWQPQGASMVGWTNVMVVADTANQAIRVVNFGSRTTSLLAGTPTVTGNCLDETCPANSFRDGVGSSATLTMPYSVQLHEHRRYAMVADTRSNAIRKVDMYSYDVHTPLRGVGYPTDVVSMGDWMVFTEGGNHTVWIYRGATSGLMSFASGGPAWPQSGLSILSGGSGSAASPGQYAEGTGGASGTARFWEPLSVTYNTRSGVLYVADFRNRVIREVSLSTGNTARRVGRNDVQASIVDSNNPLTAVLVGPTSVRYHHATDSVYFTDRSYEGNAGAVRVWSVATNTVRTVVGQSTRRSGDGLVTSPLVGSGAAWGVAVGQNGGWVAWTEADTSSIRVAAQVCVFLLLCVCRFLKGSQ